MKKVHQNVSSKMRFLKIQILARKTGSGCPGDIKNMGDHYKTRFLVYLYHTLKKMWETGKFKEKPEPRLIFFLSGKNFRQKPS